MDTNDCLVLAIRFALKHFFVDSKRVSGFESDSFRFALTDLLHLRASPAVGINSRS